MKRSCLLGLPLLCTLVGCSHEAEKIEKPAIEIKKQVILNTPSKEEKPMITKTSSGLSYNVLKPSENGDAKAPHAGKRVTVHYTGWLADQDGNPRLDKKFDSSVDRGTPFTFVIGVGQVIKGWDEGVMTMKVGEKRRLIIPAHLGYGAHGAGASIPPHATLVFDVDLIDVA